MADIVVGDNGTVLTITVSDDDGAVNLTTATGVIANFVKPNDGTYTKTLTVTTAAGGICTVTLASADVDIAGTYAFQTVVTFIDGTTFRGTVKRLKVVAAL